MPRRNWSMQNRKMLNMFYSQRYTHPTRAWIIQPQEQRFDRINSIIESLTQNLFICGSFFFWKEFTFAKAKPYTLRDVCNRKHFLSCASNIAKHPFATFKATIRLAFSKSSYLGRYGNVRYGIVRPSLHALYDAMHARCNLDESQRSWTVLATVKRCDSSKQTNCRAMRQPQNGCNGVGKLGLDKSYG